MRDATSRVGLLPAEFEARDDTHAVGERPVLAHLLLAFEPRDREAQPDDALQLRPDEASREDRQPPRAFARAFVQPGWGASRRQRGRVVEELGGGVGAVPLRSSCCRHDLAVLALRGIPVASHRRRGPWKIASALADRRGVPLRIGARQMAVQHPVLAFGLVEKKRQRRRLEPGRRGRDECREPHSPASSRCSACLSST